MHVDFVGILIFTLYALKGLMLKLHLQYFGHPMQRANSSKRA